MCIHLVRNNGFLFMPRSMKDMLIGLDQCVGPKKILGQPINS
jgi:hypothetical protein